MVARFQIVVTSGFSRSLKKAAGKHPEIVGVYQTALEALEADPFNVTHRNHIKKLTGVAAGEGR